MKRVEPEDCGSIFAWIFNMRDHLVARDSEEMPGCLKWERVIRIFGFEYSYFWYEDELGRLRYF